MLPQNNNAIGKIYVNPNFKGNTLQNTATYGDTHTTHVAPPIPVSAHINPLFWEKQNTNSRPAIHMNPMFLQKLRKQQGVNLNSAMPNSSSMAAPTFLKSQSQQAGEKDGESYAIATTANVKLYPTEERKIICKSKNCLIREPAMSTPAEKRLPPKTPAVQDLVVISKSKLVRKSVNSAQNTLDMNTAKQQLVTKTNKTRYKLDNRVIRKKGSLPFLAKIKVKSFVGRYALRRTNGQSTSTPTAVKGGLGQCMNKKLQLLNINGLLYKSTRNKLQLKDASETTVKGTSNLLIPATSSTTRPVQRLTIFVRGTKYVMDAQKFKLTRVSRQETTSLSHSSNKRSRIDIGGFTYVSAPYAKNVLIRTRNHLSRAYVHNAKQKSVHVLTKHLVKSNIPCPIYQRLGKCAAFERGKCSKVHNKLQIALCSKFLRGECLKTDCLLSHDVSLSKMPVCKFFLQGVCVRNDCPYLHKKLSNNAEVCIEFLRGFCKLAEKCNKRHEFVCPDLERNGTCTNKTCIYCKMRLKKDKNTKLLQNQEHKSANSANEPVSTSDVKETADKSTGKRYFTGSSADVETMTEENTSSEGIPAVDENEDLLTNREQITKRRPKLGELPAFIPLQ